MIRKSSYCTNVKLRQNKIKNNNSKFRYRVLFNVKNKKRTNRAFIGREKKI